MLCSLFVVKLNFVLAKFLFRVFFNLTELPMLENRDTKYLVQSDLIVPNTLC